VSSLILRTTTRFLMPLLLLFSVFVLFSGHNTPGGGFVGGLAVAAALALYAIAHDAESAYRVLSISPQTLIGTGLLLASGSGAVSLLRGQPFMTGQWVSWHILGLGEVALGTPVLFDIGVYLVVPGVMLLIILSLAEA
jgi:multicomponent Na+:H+ antiporter subunit B